MSDNAIKVWSTRVILAIIVLALLAIAAIYWFETNPSNAKLSGKVKDEALLAGRMADSFPPADEDYFKEMDRGIQLSPDEVKGRNTWVVWTGGNDRFWDYMANHTFGAFDLLKTLSSHPSLYYGRDNRWNYLGLVNEPCFNKAAGPVDEHYGLWLDVRDDNAGCGPDPFANEEKYPGAKIGARGKNIPVGSYYGKSSGVMGLRLFPNPDFDEEAEKKWDPERYYTDPSYYNDKNLVRPYRVGMSCGFCHVGPSAINPPEDPENPKFENLIANSGAQYFWVDRIFFWDNKPVNYGGEAQENERNFVFQLFHTNPPGSLDTSFVSTDNINNPRTMNAVYDLPSRLAIAKRFGKATLENGGSNNNVQFGDFKQTEAFADFYNDPDVITPFVLKDGADSVGALGALNRVYLNIGLFSEEWLTHFRALVGGQKISPIEISVMEENSTYWNATVEQNPNVALYFLKSSPPDHLSKAKGYQPSAGHSNTMDSPASKSMARPIGSDVSVHAAGHSGGHGGAEQLDQGKVVFAENCARCHSSKLPEPIAEVEGGECEGGGSGPQYLRCWNKYWEWTKTDGFKAQMRDIVMQDDFLQNNYLSTDRRIPVTLLKTNACGPLATNALADNIWDNFSSETYKQLPAVGSVEIHHPLTGAASQYDMPGDGRGYTRVPSLISLWSTAPFLLNNSVGKFNSSPSVEARLDAFEDAIHKMLWPEKRVSDADIVKRIGLPESAAAPDVPGYIYRTTAASCLKVPNGYLPLPGWLANIVFGSEGLEVGPIPKGTPIGLLSNIQILPETDNPLMALKHRLDILRLANALKKSLKENGIKGACTEEALSNMDKQDNVLDVYLKNDVVERMIAVSKCPDYVVNKGHYFGTQMDPDGNSLSDSDKLALIEFLKTF